MEKIKNEVLERFDNFSKEFRNKFESIPSGMENMPVKLQLVSNFLENDFKVFCTEEFSKYDIESDEREAVNECFYEILGKLQTMAILT